MRRGRRRGRSRGKRATARLICQHGAKVVIVDIQDDLGLSVAVSIGSDNIITFIHCDVSKEDDVRNAVDLAVAKYGKLPGFDDCKDCFDLVGRERHSWVTPSANPLDFTIDDVLAAASPPGFVRIGLDIGDGTGTFAVRMWEQNVTVVTTSMNLNGPFNDFIAARGMVPLYLSVSQRLPFFDNTLDIVHSMHVLSNWIPTTLLHFIVFDVYQVLRPGGLFWLDRFFFVEEQMGEYVPVIESVGFRKLKWEVGRKLDRDPELKEMYISALLEKPLKN